MVESNIWMRCADELIAASASKKASKTPVLLSRSKRFHTLFQGPKRSGKARHRTFSNEALRGSAGRLRLSGLAGEGTRETPSACAPNLPHPSLSTCARVSESTGDL